MTTQAQAAIWRRVASEGAMGEEAAGMAVPELCEMLERAATLIEEAVRLTDALVENGAVIRCPTADQSLTARGWLAEYHADAPTPDAWTPTSWKLRMDGGATIDVFADGGWAVYTANCGRILATGHHDTVDAAKLAAVESWRRVTGRG
jgi:hypothetical protein